MKMKLFVLGALLLSLTGCASLRANVAQPATDLQVLQLAVVAMTEPREIAGSIQHPDQAANGGQLLDVALDLDDVHFLDTQDKLRLRTFVTDAIRAIAASRLPECPWYGVRCRRDRAAALAAFPGPLPPATGAAPEGASRDRGQ